MPANSVAPILGDETFRRLSEQAQRLPNRPHVSTLWRWATHGCRGVRLETVRIGGFVYCTDSALARFLEACNERPEVTIRRPRTRRETKAAVAKAQRILKSAGI